MHIRATWFSMACSKLFSSNFTSQHCSHSLSVLFICKEDFSLTSVFPYGLFLQGRESTLRIDVRPNSIPHNSLKMVLCINTSGSSLFSVCTPTLQLLGDCKNMMQFFKGFQRHASKENQQEAEGLMVLCLDSFPQGVQFTQLQSLTSA